jgi:hypothetical protein
MHSERQCHRRPNNLFHSFFLFSTRLLLPTFLTAVLTAAFDFFVLCLVPHLVSLSARNPRSILFAPA